jgi:uncharacterized protein
MLIAIISDIHDNIPNLKNCLDKCKSEKVAKIICCGDVGNNKTLKFLSTNFLGEIFLVEGNGDTYSKSDLDKYKNINYQGFTGQEKLEGVKIGFCHKKQDIKKMKEKLNISFDYIFYGHSHKPWLEKQNNTIIVNPGNIAGIFYQPTFALFATKNKILKLEMINR